jgi:hypothetical protein
VEWLKVKALSSSPCTKKKKKKASISDPKIGPEVENKNNKIFRFTISHS